MRYMWPEESPYSLNIALASAVYLVPNIIVCFEYKDTVFCFYHTLYLISEWLVTIRVGPLGSDILSLLSRPKAF